MGKEDIVRRIISDAEAEAERALDEAKAKAEEITAQAEARAQSELAEAEREAGARANAIREGKAASARLDSAKILLAEKRRVIDVIYDRALAKLIALGEHDCVALFEKLLKQYADEGDEIEFVAGFRYKQAVCKLPVVAERKLTISSSSAKIAGGCILHGKTSDKDLSFESLLKNDMDEHQAELAASLFN